jgi:hypothetical protein
MATRGVSAVTCARPELLSCRSPLHIIADAATGPTDIGGGIGPTGRLPPVRGALAGRSPPRPSRCPSATRRRTGAPAPGAASRGRRGSWTRTPHGTTPSCSGAVRPPGRGRCNGRHGRRTERGGVGGGGWGGVGVAHHKWAQTQARGGRVHGDGISMGGAGVGGGSTALGLGVQATGGANIPSIAAAHHHGGGVLGAASFACVRPGQHGVDCPLLPVVEERDAAVPGQRRGRQQQCRSFLSRRRGRGWGVSAHELDEPLTRALGLAVLRLGPRRRPRPERQQRGGSLLFLFLVRVRVRVFRPPPCPPLPVPPHGGRRRPRHVPPSSSPSRQRPRAPTASTGRWRRCPSPTTGSPSLSASVA